MPFTEDEKRAWHAEKRAREHRPLPKQRPALVAICVHCQNPFGIGEGAITEEAALCDLCLGD